MPTSEPFENGGAPVVQQPTHMPTGFGEAPPVIRFDRTEAQPPRAPALPARLELLERQREQELRAREALERRSMLRGLILLAVIVLVLSLAFAEAGRAFPPGWWRRW